jgi:hypothetical protein
VTRLTIYLVPGQDAKFISIESLFPRTTAGALRRRPLAFERGAYRADQPPSEARMAPSTLVPSSLSRKVMAAASCAAVAGVGTVAPDRYAQT